MFACAWEEGAGRGARQPAGRCVVPVIDDQEGSPAGWLWNGRGLHSRAARDCWLSKSLQMQHGAWAGGRTKPIIPAADQGSGDKLMQGTDVSRLKALSIDRLCGGNGGRLSISEHFRPSGDNLDGNLFLWSPTFHGPQREAIRKRLVGRRLALPRSMPSMQTAGASILRQRRATAQPGDPFAPHMPCVCGCELQQATQHFLVASAIPASAALCCGHNYVRSRARLSGQHVTGHGSQQRQRQDQQMALTAPRNAFDTAVRTKSSIR